jgi:5-(carboxyamino)imidazole ribonucleotide synthase
MSAPTVGMIGAGQLAQMSLAPAIALGINLKILASDESDSAAKIAKVVVGDYRDLEVLRNFAKSCDFLTFEHELVPNGHLRILEEEGFAIRPSSKSLLVAQDKAHMRKVFTENQIPCPEWKVVDNASAIPKFPAILKSITGGYDGRGVQLVNDENSAKKVIGEWGKALYEEVVPFDRELSILIARSPHNQVATWTVTETIQRDGICVETITPAPNLSEEVANLAQQIASDIANTIKLVGVMAVELFQVGEQLIVNEIALRPHNSGHWSIEGSVTSQFEQHLRAVLDLPLGETKMTAKWAVMANILGTENSDLYRPYLHLFARDPELKIHNYGKEVRLGRKVGHATVVGEDLAELRGRAAHAIDYISGVVSE